MSNAYIAGLRKPPFQKRAAAMTYFPLYLARVLQSQRAMDFSFNSLSATIEADYAGGNDNARQRHSQSQGQCAA